MSDRDSSRVYMQPAGLTVLQVAMRQVLNDSFNGFTEQCRKNLMLFAITTGLVDIIEDVEKLDKETEHELELTHTEKGYGNADSYGIKKKALEYLYKRNMVVYSAIMKGLARHGITQKMLEQHSSNVGANMEW